ncbi:MAG: protealysin inhibitor emfourin, partial [Actinomycetes bacterium]
GVHINSGIPNSAFARAAVSLGGPSWERAGRVWYNALTAGEVTTSTDFVGFASATLSSAARVFPDDPAVTEAVRSGWLEVGVLADSGSVAVGSSAAPVPAPAAAPGRVAVRRTGGFAGIVRSGELDLAEGPRGQEVRELLGQVDPKVGTGRPGGADRFVYTVEYGDTRMRVPERELTPELFRVVQIVLGDQDEPPPE